MLKYIYTCNGGSLMVGNDEFCAHFLNHYGDGDHYVYVVQKGDRPLATDADKWDFVGCVQGRIYVYDCDCLNAARRNDPKHQLCFLVGLYGVFAKKNSGDMALEFWDYDD